MSSSEKEKTSDNTRTNLALARIALLRRKLTVSGDAPKLDGYTGEPETPETEGPAPTGPADTTLPIESYTGQSKKGFAPFNVTKKNQDTFIIRLDPPTNSIIFAVLDGHGEVGHFISEVIKQCLSVMLLDDPAWKKDVPTAIKSAIQRAENHLFKIKSISSQFSGTTLVMGIVRGKTLYCGNIGDSRLILGTLNDKNVLVPTPVSIDHKPDLPAEKARIEESGGRVSSIRYEDELGPPRVWLKQMEIPGLAMSRSIGDTVAHSVGVTSEPEIFIRELTPKDKYIVLASDGLWEFMSNEQVIQVVSNNQRLDDSISDLMKISSDLWIKNEQVIDDTTIILVRLRV